jgi:hypothetical protein
MKYPTLKSKPVPNFPQKLDKTQMGTNVFPNDLIADGRNYYTQIQFVDYAFGQQFSQLPFGFSPGSVGFTIPFTNIQLSVNTSGSGIARPSGGVFLPIPLKLNDNQILNWNEFPLLQSVAGAAADNAFISAGSIALGASINPLMFLQFKRPEFRTFQFSWVLAPRTKQESDTIKNIVTKCKQAAAPQNFGALLGYPQIAMIRLHPKKLDEHLKFKPCVIESVQVSYTPNPTPSFFESGAPSTVTLTMNFKEMQYWYRNEIT